MVRTGKTRCGRYAKRGNSSHYFIEEGDFLPQDVKFFFFKYHLLALRSIDEEVFIFYSVTI